MTETELKAAVNDVLRGIAPEADVTRVDPDADLRESLDIDSFDYLNVLIGLHQKTGVDIPESDYGQVRSLNALIRYLAARASHDAHA